MRPLPGLELGERSALHEIFQGNTHSTWPNLTCYWLLPLVPCRSTFQCLCTSYAALPQNDDDRETSHLIPTSLHRPSVDLSFFDQGLKRWLTCVSDHTRKPREYPYTVFRVLLLMFLIGHIKFRCVVWILITQVWIDCSVNVQVYTSTE